MLILLIAISISVIFYLIAVRPFTYWTRKGIVQYHLLKIWLENLKLVLQWKPVAENVKKTYAAFADARYCGIYQFLSPLLLIRDPDLIKQVGVKDFDHFIDHNQFISEEMDSLWGKNLLSLKGDRWKDMRSTLSPSFTSSKMKTMFCLMSECADNFVKFFEKSETITLELKDAFTRYTNDVIASVAFGVNCNSLQHRDNEFYTMGREATNFSGFWRNLSFVLMIGAPKLAKFLGVTVFNKKVSVFFRRLVSENIKSRERSGIVRPDMINLLMEAKNERLVKTQEPDVDADRSMLKRELSDDDLTAQALIFFFAGFESVSTLMCFTAYELAVDPMVQRKLQDEIDTTWQCETTLTYEALQKMEYLDMVISETLRKWPSAIATDRVCVKPYTIEPKHKGEKPISLKKGDVIWLPIIALHYDEQYFPEPDRFIPERFSHENKKNLNSYAYIPFGVGPRNCIGNRFALLETKILFVNLLKRFDIVIVDKSVVPMKLSRKQFNPTSENGFWFGLKPRQTTL